MPSITNKTFFVASYEGLRLRLSHADRYWETRREESSPHLPFKELDNEDDQALMHRIQGGDQEAFRMLFDRYSGLLQRVGAQIIGDASEAEDLVQECSCTYSEKAMYLIP